MRKTLLFDLDGTLLNTLEDLRDSTNFALRTYGYPERSLEEVRRFVGNGLKMLLTRAVPQGSSEVEIERALACMKAHYCENYHNKTVPYPGIPELLQRLQQAGFRMAIVSNKADPAVQLIRTLYFDGIIDVAVGESPACSKKPAPDMVLAALQRLGSKRTMRSISATPRSICRLRGIPVSPAPRSAGASARRPSCAQPGRRRSITRRRCSARRC